MSGKNTILNQIAAELRIGCGNSENSEAWEARVAYSAAGRIALASLWDKEEDGTSVSVVHFKKRAERELNALISLYPELQNKFSADLNEVTESIYQTYLNSGYIYHTPGHLEIAKDCEVDSGGISFIRGAALDESICMSGLGLYKRVERTNDKEGLLELKGMFHIPTNNFEFLLSSLCKQARWNRMPAPDADYLRINPPFRNGYWTSNADKSGTISMFRTGEKGRELYYLYKWEEESFMAFPLPSWMVDKYEYRRISTAILLKNKNLPAIRYIEDKNLVDVSLGYLLPPAELNLLRLYSWPMRMRNFPSDFHRLIQREVFLVIRALLESEGFTFVKGATNV